MSSASPARLNRTAPIPLWRQLASDLRHRLDAGEFRDSLPGELDLMAQYGVSRHTVRDALRQLRDDGVLTTGRGRRRRPAEPGDLISQPTGVVYSRFSSVQGSGHTQKSVVRALNVRADGLVAVRLGLEESTPLLYLERLRLADDLPLALDRVWLPAAIGEPLLTVDFSHTGMYDQLLATTGIPVTGGEETVRAVIPSPAEHAILGVTPPSAAFAVERTATSRGVPIEWRQTLIRADRFCLTSSLSTQPVRPTGTMDGAPATLTLSPTYD